MTKTDYTQGRYDMITEMEDALNRAIKANHGAKTMIDTIGAFNSIVASIHMMKQEAKEELKKIALNEHLSRNTPLQQVHHVGSAEDFMILVQQVTKGGHN